MSTSPSLLPQTELEPPPNVKFTDLTDELPLYPQFLLLGDSITQFSTLTFQPYLQTQYIRRLDVVNRGLSGYTAQMGYRALRRFLPAEIGPLTRPPIKLATVFFGANDACVPGESQHVELQVYVDTLRKIVNYSVFNQSGGAKTEIVLITPPPVNEHQFQRNGQGNFQRRAGTTSQYAQAARELGRSCNVHVLDLWTILMRKVGWRAAMGRDCCCDHLPYHIDSSPSSAKMQHIPGCIKMPTCDPLGDYQLSDFLTDGLHLTKLGYDVMFWELLKLIKAEIPRCAPENLPFILPEWQRALQLDQS